MFELNISSLLIAIATLVILGPLARLIYKRYKFVSVINKIPGPKAYPIVGTSWQFIGLKREGY